LSYGASVTGTSMPTCPKILPVFQCPTRNSSCVPTLST
jgi:hypothetical protein